jgi:hypothetical protein
MLIQREGNSPIESPLSPIGGQIGAEGEGHQSSSPPYLHTEVNLAVLGNGVMVIRQALPAVDQDVILWTLMVDSGTLSISENTGPTVTIYDPLNNPLAGLVNLPLTGWDNPNPPAATINVYHAPDLSTLGPGFYILRTSVQPTCTGDQIMRRRDLWAVIWIRNTV